MGLLGKLLRRSPKDPYWDRFINAPLADPANEMSFALRSAPPGKVFPVKSEVPEPTRMAQDLAQLADFLGASVLGVAALDPGDLRPSVSADTEHGDGPSAVAESYPFVIVCAVPAEYDPSKAQGIGGQHARRESASVSFSIAAYIRELGYQAIVHPVDSARVAAKAGLGDRGTKVFVGDAVLTDLPVALGRPVAPGRSKR